MRIPLATDLKTRTDVPDKDARLKNAYVEVKNGESYVRKRLIAQGGVSIGTGTAQGGIGFSFGGTDYVFTVNGDVTATNTNSIGTTWNAGTAYSQGTHVVVNFVDYWAIDDNMGNDPTTSPTHWSPTFYPANYPVTSWTLGTLDFPPDPQNSPIAWNGTTFCYVNNNENVFGSGIGSAYTSSDGLTWTQHDALSAIGDSWPIVWNGTYFCAIADPVGSGIISGISLNGISWSEQIDTTSLLHISDMAWNGTVFCAVSVNGVATSSNGISWTLQAFPDAGGADAIAWNGSVFCAIRRSSAIAFTSSNGSTWTQQTLPISSTWERIKALGSTFCILHVGNVAAASTNNGVSWTVSSVPYNNGGGICSSNSKFLVTRGAGSANFVSTSTDGITWTTQTVPATKVWASTAYGNRFTIIDSGSDPNSTCAASTGL